MRLAPPLGLLAVAVAAAAQALPMPAALAVGALAAGCYALATRRGVPS